jgi:hypothetical protein
MSERGRRRITQGDKEGLAMAFEEPDQDYLDVAGTIRCKPFECQRLYNTLYTREQNR